MLNNRKKLGIAATAVIGALALGGGALAFAETTTPTPTPTTSVGQTGTEVQNDKAGDKQEKEGANEKGDKGEKEGPETNFTGSVKAPAENGNEVDHPDGSPEEAAQQKAESEALAKLATVTQDQATKAATSLVPGTVQKVELGDSDGYVAWQVEIVKADGTNVEVIVDAGNVGNLVQEAA